MTLAPKKKKKLNGMYLYKNAQYNTLNTIQILGVCEIQIIARKWMEKQLILFKLQWGGATSHSPRPRGKGSEWDQCVFV